MAYLTVTVAEAVPVTSSFFGTHTEYIIEIVEAGCLSTIQKRFRAFTDLHQKVLDELRPDTECPELPRKRMFNRLDPMFVEQRRAGLNRYLSILTSSNSMGGGWPRSLYSFLQLTPATIALARFLSLPRGDMEGHRDGQHLITQMMDDMLMVGPKSSAPVPLSISEAYALLVFGCLSSFASSPDFCRKCSHPAVIRRLTQQLLVERSKAVSMIADSLLLSLLFTLYRSNDLIATLAKTRGHYRLIDYLYRSFSTKSARSFHLIDSVIEIILTMASRDPRAFRDIVAGCPALLKITENESMADLHPFIALLLLIVCIGLEKPAASLNIVTSPQMQRKDLKPQIPLILDRLLSLSPSVTARTIAGILKCRVSGTPDLQNLLTYLRANVQLAEMPSATDDVSCRSSDFQDFLLSSSVDDFKTQMLGGKNERTMYFNMVQKLANNLSTTNTDDQLVPQIQRIIESPDADVISHPCQLTPQANPNVLDSHSLIFATNIAFDTIVLCVSNIDTEDQINSPSSTFTVSTTSSTISLPIPSAKHPIDTRLEFILWLLATLTPQMRLTPGSLSLPKGIRVHELDQVSVAPFNALIPPVTCHLHTANSFLCNGIAEFILYNLKGVDCEIETVRRLIGEENTLLDGLRKLGLWHRSPIVRELASRVYLFVTSDTGQKPMMVSECTEAIQVLRGLARSLVEMRPEQYALNRIGLETERFEHLGRVIDRRMNPSDVKMRDMYNPVNGSSREIPNWDNMGLCVLLAAHKVACNLGAVGQRRGVLSVLRERQQSMLTAFECTSKSLTTGGRELLNRLAQIESEYNHLAHQADECHNLETNLNRLHAEYIHKTTMCRDQISESKIDWNDQRAQIHKQPRRDLLEALQTLRSRRAFYMNRRENILKRNRIESTGEDSLLLSEAPPPTPRIRRNTRSLDDLKDTHSTDVAPSADESNEILCELTEEINSLTEQVTWTENQINVDITGTCQRKELQHLGDVLRTMKNRLTQSLVDCHEKETQLENKLRAEQTVLIDLVRMIAVVEMDLDMLTLGNSALQIGLNDEQEERNQLALSMQKLCSATTVIEQWITIDEPFS